MPYAISALVRYTIIVAGVVVAIAALGVDWNRITFVAGALGVGIGIVLQSVVANFVSGLILLFERRMIQVGDSVQIGDLQGQVRASQASTIRTWEGAEVIVPNAALTSERVTNWKLSDALASRGFHGASRLYGRPRAGARHPQRRREGASQSAGRSAAGRAQHEIWRQRLDLRPARVDRSLRGVGVGAEPAGDPCARRAGGRPDRDAFPQRDIRIRNVDGEPLLRPLSADGRGEDDQ